MAAAIITLQTCAGFPLRCDRSLAPRATPPRLISDLLNQSISKGFSKVGCPCNKKSSFSFRAVAIDSGELGSFQTAREEKPRKYYFLVANAKFMLDDEEHFQELLFEKRRNYVERKKEHDFWLVIEPKFLDQFPNITKRLKRPAVALVSTDDLWMRFMKLRLDKVLSGNFEAESFEEALTSNGAHLNFEKPEKWVAPYPKYEFGWWEPFLPQLAM